MKTLTDEGGPSGEPEPIRHSTPPVAGSTISSTLGARLAVAMLAILSVLQALFFGFRGGSARASVFAIALAAATLLVRARFRAHPKWSIVGMACLAGLIAMNVAVDIARTEPPFPLRIVEVAVILGYAVIGIAGLASLTRRNRFESVLVVMMPVASILLLGEWLLERKPGIVVRSGAVTWEGRMLEDSILGERYAPNTVYRTYYPDNPRGYFDIPHHMQRRWTLETHEDAEARLEFQPSAPTSMRVRIGKQTKLPWYIQVSQERLPLHQTSQYSVRFRARADGRRTIGVATSQAHAPWENLGYYREIMLDTAWQAFSDTLRPTMDEVNARFGFTLGVSDVGVELADIELRRLPENELLEATAHTGFSVTYRMNNMGCRGRDYTVPHDSAVWRILSLGDSRALGVGVHESDAYPAQLERLLNEGGKSTGTRRTYEVINCAVSGYSTRQERLFYERIAARYAPDVVLLAPVPNDDISWREEVEKHYVLPHDKYQELFLTWAAVQQLRSAWRRPPRDYSRVRDEIRLLAQACQQRHTRFAILLFESDPDPFWRPLERAVDEAVRGTDVPILNVGPLFAQPAREAPVVDPAYDNHPNEFAHRIAAEALRDFLRRERLDGTEGASPGAVPPLGTR